MGAIGRVTCPPQTRSAGAAPCRAASRARADLLAGGGVGGPGRVRDRAVAGGAAGHPGASRPGKPRPQPQSGARACAPAPAGPSSGKLRRPLRRPPSRSCRALALSRRALSGVLCFIRSRPPPLRRAPRDAATARRRCCRPTCSAAAACTSAATCSCWPGPTRSATRRSSGRFCRRRAAAEGRRRVPTRPAQAGRATVVGRARGARAGAGRGWRARAHAPPCALRTCAWPWRRSHLSRSPVLERAARCHIGPAWRAWRAVASAARLSSAPRAVGAPPPAQHPKNRGRRARRRASRGAPTAGAWWWCCRSATSWRWRATSGACCRRPRASGRALCSARRARAGAVPSPALRPPHRRASAFYGAHAYKILVR